MQEQNAATYWSSRLNAIAVRFFPDPLSVLLSDEDAPSDRLVSSDCLVLSDRLAEWDQQCLTFLSLPEDHGFRPFLAGGEEDYDEDNSAYSDFCRKRQLTNARILYTRLMAEKSSALRLLPQNTEQFLSLFSDCPGALPLLGEISSHAAATATLYREAGLLSPDNLPRILDLLSPARVELRSALLSAAKAGSSHSFLDSLSL